MPDERAQARNLGGTAKQPFALNEGGRLFYSVSPSVKAPVPGARPLDLYHFVGDGAGIPPAEPKGEMDMKLNGAAILIECLIEQGAGTVFGFPGGAVLPQRTFGKLLERRQELCQGNRQAF